MRVFKVREFDKQCRRLRVDDAMLQSVAKEVIAGNVDAFLGGEVLKQRIARPGGGKSGGFRTLLIFRAGHRCIFMDIFAKNSQATIDQHTLKTYRELAKIYLGFDEAAIDQILSSGIWKELVLP